ncbi:MAG: hypothetical protein AB7Q92_30905 [Acidimicrobiia bacterium]
MTSDLRPAGRVVKASAVRLRRVDPHTVPTDQRIAEAEAAAYRAGYEEGYHNGAVEAGRELAAAVASLQQSVLAAVEQHRREAARARAADAERLVELALAVAEWAVRRELSSVPAAFFARLGELLAERDRHQVVEVFTAPELLEATRTWLAEAEPLHGAGIRVSAAEDLEAGEARVLLDDTTVFATFTDAFERAREALDRAHHTDQYGESDHPDHPDGPEDPDDEVVEVLYDASALLGEVAP